MDADKLREKLKNLHMQAFEEDNRYIDYFFENKYKKENCFFLRENDDIATVLYMLYKKMHYRTFKIKCAFFSGIATDVKYRNKGYCKKNIICALEYLHKNNIPFAFLRPFDFEFYAKLGFATVSRFPGMFCRDGHYLSEIGPSDAKMLAVFYKKYCQRAAFLHRSEDDFKHLLKEQQAYGGKSYAVYKDNRLRGYALYENGKCNEYLVDGQLYEDFGMGRIVNLKKAVETMASKKYDYSVNINVTDNLLACNNLSLNITCKDKKIAVCEIAHSGDYTTYTIAELCKCLLGQKSINTKEQVLFNSFEFFMADSY